MMKDKLMAGIQIMTRKNKLFNKFIALLIICCLLVNFPASASTFAAASTGSTGTTGGLTGITGTTIASAAASAKSATTTLASAVTTMASVTSTTGSAITVTGGAITITGGAITVDPIVVNGADVFVCIPDGIVLDRWTAPIIQVFGDEKFTAETAGQTAVDSGLAAIAAEEHACISFVNPIGDTWSEADVATYMSIIKNKYAERPDNTWSNGKTSAGVYAGYPFRVVVVGDGSGANFATRYLANDNLGEVFSGTKMIHRIPAAFMLFNTTEVPSSNATINREYPAVIVNGTAGVGNAYRALNKTSSHVAVLTSSVTDGFDPAIIRSGFDTVAGRVFRLGLDYADTVAGGNFAIFEVPDYEALGLDTAYNSKTVTTGTTKVVNYHQFIPGSVDRSVAGSVPLVIGFHGMGEKSEYYSMLSDWPSVAAKEGFMFVAVDQHLSYTAAQMVELVDMLTAEYSFIDTTRIYVTGFSMGAYKTWQMGLGYPSKFAAIAPMDVAANVTASSTDYILPTIFVNAENDYVNPFPFNIYTGTVVTSTAAKNLMTQLFTMNKLGTYPFDATLNKYWGTSFTSTESITAAHGGSTITVNSLKSADGNVYTKLVNVSRMSHSMTQDYAPIVWNFLKQFKRNSDGSIVKIDPNIDQIKVNGADVFVYIPDGIVLDRWTAPIIEVFGDEKFSVDTAKQTAIDSGLADIAAEEHACIAFVNPIGDTWGEADVATYMSLIKNKYAERPDNTWSNGKTSAGVYAGYPFRVVVVGDGSGADFATRYLANDTLGEVFSGTKMIHRIPASFMLFNTTEIPSSKATINREYPAVIVNGAAGVGDAYRALNKTSSHVSVLTSSVTDGFDPAIIKSGFDNVAGRVMRLGLDYADTVAGGNFAIFDIPDYDKLGLEVQYNSKTVTTGTTKEVFYHQFIPNSVNRNAAGSVPLVIGFHGMGEKSEYYSILSDWPSVAAKEGFMFVAVDQHLSCTAAQMVELLDKLIAQYSFIDTTRIYVTGFSMGAYKTWQMGFGYPQRFAAIAPMDVSINVTASSTDYILPTIFVNGESDYLNPFPFNYTTGTVVSSTAAKSLLTQLFKMNKLGTYPFDASLNKFWGTSFTSSTTVAAAHGSSTITTNLLFTGNVAYTRLVNVSNMSHSMTQDYAPMVWNFLKQFKRETNGNITVLNSSGTGNQGTTPTTPSTDTTTPTTSPTTTPVPAEGEKDKSEVSIEITKGDLNAQNQLVLTASEDLVKQIKDTAVKTVELKISKADGLDSVEGIILQEDLLKAAQEQKKSLEINVDGAKGYTWIFDKDDLASVKDMKDINLDLSIAPLTDYKKLSEELGKSAADAMVIQLDHNGDLPAQASIKIYAGNQPGITPGTKVYQYIYNQKTGKLETLPNSSYTVDADGYITTNVISGADYVLLKEKAPEESITSLRDQITVKTEDRTLNLADGKANTEITINLPSTLTQVASLKKAPKDGAVAGVTVAFSSSDSSILKVDKDGKVTALKAGEATITTKVTLYNGKIKTVKTKIKVK